MKTLKNILSLTLIGSMLIFAGCEDDESTQTISKDKAEETLTTNSQEMASDFEEMASTDGMKAMEVLAGLSQKQDPFAQKKLRGSESVIKGIKDIVNPSNENIVKKLGEQPFDFQAHTGTYSWQVEGWQSDPGNPGNAIVIEFPTDTTEEPIANDGTLTLSAYEETMVIDSAGNENYVPTDVQANLKIEGEQVMEVTWDLVIGESDDGSPILTSLDGTISLEPYTYTVSLTPSSLSASISDDDADKTLMSINLDITFLDENMKDVEKIDGNVQAHNLNFQGWTKPYAMQPENVEGENIQSTGDLIDYYNDQIDVALYTYDDGNKIADVKFVESNNSDKQIPMELVFEFKDDSTESVQKYFETLISKIEQHLESYNI